MRVLAIDASLRNTGVAIVDANNGKPQSVYFGTIHNKSAMRPSSCLVCIRDRLAELIREHAPDCCALESVIYVQSYKTAIILGAARGAAILAAAEKGLPVFEYPPKRIKQSTVGRGGGFVDDVLLNASAYPIADTAPAPGHTPVSLPGPHCPWWPSGLSPTWSASPAFAGGAGVPREAS